MKGVIKTSLTRIFLLTFVLSNVFAHRSLALSCTLTGNSLDNLEYVKTNCKEIIVEDLLVPPGKTLDFTGISDVSIVFKGKTSFEFKKWKGPLVLVSGNNVNITGAEGAVIDGNGTQWWNQLGGSGSILRPRMFKLRYVNNVNVNNLYFLNSPRHCFAIHNCTNVTVTNVVIDDSAGDTYYRIHNTDGFDVKGSENVYIKDVQVFNQDDCLAVRSGKNIHFARGYCYHGHGLSIGSVGNRTNNIVENVYITDSKLVNADNGIRIKTVFNCTGSVTNIYYNNITMSGIQKVGIVLQGDYRNTRPTGTPTDGVPIKNVTITNVRGTVSESGTNIYILLADGVAENWYWENVTVTGGMKKRKCSGIPEGSHAFCD
ncbi:polygalacturonase-like [Agrilus planipennis]|uniref:endo-polygalacturonase n=1 Tax=Agrilus planipennis TaxID=224129 RepID=A0A1W4WNI9_AGRPL|nr:polygalacturonase-like [Agrilus planipennis]